MSAGLFFFAVNGPVAKLGLVNGLQSAELSAFRIGQDSCYNLYGRPDRQKRYGHEKFY